MAGPKPAALPLGHTPIISLLLYSSIIYLKNVMSTMELKNNSFCFFTQYTTITSLNKAYKTYKAFKLLTFNYEFILSYPKFLIKPCLDTLNQKNLSISQPLEQHTLKTAKVLQKKALRFWFIQKSNILDKNLLKTSLHLFPENYLGK